MNNHVRTTCLMLGLILWHLVFNQGAQNQDQIGTDQNGIPFLVDHHAHLLSPDLVADWKALGVPFSKPDSTYIHASSLLTGPSGDESTNQPVGKAILVPMAHLYGNASMREALNLSETEEHDRVRHENDYVAREANLFPDRAVAFCSVNFLRPYAFDEIRRCKRDLGSAGIKLHLANARTDFGNKEHLQKLARVAAWAEAEGVALLIHVDPFSGEFTEKEVMQFIAYALEPNPGLVICIAHLGGSGGYGLQTQANFRTFTDWLAAETASGIPRRGVFFDISAIWLEEETEGLPPTTAEEGAALLADLRRTGLQRIVFGSDYPVFIPQRYAEILRSAVGFSASEWATLVQNKMPIVP